MQLIDRTVMGAASKTEPHQKGSEKMSFDHYLIIFLLI